MGKLVQPRGGGRASEDCLEVCFVGLVVGGNYVWCLVIVVIFMGFGGAKRWGMLQSLHLGWQYKPQEGIFYGNGSSHYVIWRMEVLCCIETLL